MGGERLEAVGDMGLEGVRRPARPRATGRCETPRLGTLILMLDEYNCFFSLKQIFISL